MLCLCRNVVCSEHRQENHSERGLDDNFGFKHDVQHDANKQLLAIVLFIYENIKVYCVFARMNKGTLQSSW